MHNLSMTLLCYTIVYNKHENVSRILEWISLVLATEVSTGIFSFFWKLINLKKLNQIDVQNLSWFNI